MSLWLKILIGFILLLIIAVGVAWFSLSAPDRAIARNPIMSEIRKAHQPWETRLTLLGSVFQAGQSKSEFEKIVKTASFIPNPDFRLYFNKDDTIASTELVWSVKQGSSVCNMEWAIIAQFDEDNKLISADGVVSERGCL